MRKKKTLDDYRFEIMCYLNNGGCQDAVELLDNYSKLLKLSEPVKYRHFGLIVVPLDLYNACKKVVPPAVLSDFEKRLNHLMQSEPDITKVLKLRNSIPQQYQNLYDEYSNVTTEETKKHYNY